MTIRQSTSIRLTILLSGTSTNTFLRQAPSGWRLRIGAFNLAGGENSPTPNTYTHTDSYACRLSIHLYHRERYDRSWRQPTRVTTSMMAIPLSHYPSPSQLYDQTYNGVNVNSNGRLDFVCINEPSGYLSAPVCPLRRINAPYDYTIFALWTDTRTEVRSLRLRELPWWYVRHLYLCVRHRAQSHLQHRMARNVIQRWHSDGESRGASV